MLFLHMILLQATGCSISPRHGNPVPHRISDECMGGPLFETIMHETSWYILTYGYSSLRAIHIKTTSIPIPQSWWSHTSYFLFHYYLPFFFFFFLTHHASPQSSPYLTPHRNLRRGSSFLWLRHIRLQPTPHAFSGPYTRWLKSTAQPLSKRRRRRSPRFHRIFTTTAAPSTATDRLPAAAAPVRRVQDRDRGSRQNCWGAWLCIMHKSLLWRALRRNPHF